MTLKQIASAIRNHVVDGLKGVNAESFSTEQLMHEIVMLSESLIAESIKQGIFSLGSLSQRIDGIEIQCDDISNNCNIDAQVSAGRITVPKLSQVVGVTGAISYIGPMDNSVNFKVYTDTDYRYHRYRQVTSKRPFVWVNTSSNSPGMYDIFFFNMGKYNNLKYISIVALYENPYTLLNTEYASQFENSEFYAPAVIQSKIIDVMTQKYVNYYRQLNTPNEPNTQEKQ